METFFLSVCLNSCLVLEWVKLFWKCILTLFWMPTRMLNVQVKIHFQNIQTFWDWAGVWTYSKKGGFAREPSTDPSTNPLRPWSWRTTGPKLSDLFGNRCRKESLTSCVFGFFSLRKNTGILENCNFLETSFCFHLVKRPTYKKYFCCFCFKFHQPIIYTCFNY